MAEERLGEIFVKAGLIDEHKLKIALEENHKNPKEYIGDTLLRLKFVTERDVARALSFQLSVPYIDLTTAVVEPNAIKLIPLKHAKKSLVFPVCLEKGYLILAMKDPLDLNTINMANFASGYNIKPYIAIETDIKYAIKQHYSQGETVDDILKNVTTVDGIEFLKDETPDEKTILDLKKEGESAPVIKLVNSIILQGVSAGASDIHIEPQEKEILVRSRVDGVLAEFMRTPKWLQGALVSRIKIMASMDIAERRVPQDGTIKMKMEDKIIDLRISTLPTQYGEKVVIRILETGKNILSPEELGMLPDELGKILNLINLPQGVILVCGPTGSGKTTTLYTLISEIAQKKLNIVTIEDPIEYRIGGVNQVQVFTKAGLTFANTLRSILRQDPDVIFVGEIRDNETAEISMRASVTGHLVLSTIHTNDAISTITRLKDLDIEPYLVGSSLAGILAQRLVRKICKECREEYTPPPAVLKKIETKLSEKVSFLFYHGKGCKSCNQTGYKGRIGVYEILEATSDIRELISKDAPEGKIREAAKMAGMKTMFDDALEKTKQGITTVEELERVLFTTEEREASDELKCSNCQKPVEPDWQVCPYCRHELNVPGPVEIINITHPSEIIQKEAISGEKHSTLKGVKILIVEEDETVGQGLTFFLRNQQFIVATAVDRKDAVKKIFRDKPHLIIVDIKMPEMAGLELIKRLRNDITTAFIPVIVLSQGRKIQDRLKGFKIGADDYLPKPFSMEELLLRIKAVLKKVYG
jgi:type IV pilus assembly protein PilB